MNRKSSDTPYKTIKKNILEGTYAPSQRLIEQELAQELSVGRQNIRAALNQLQNEGLVVIEPYRGAKVATLSLEETLDAMTARTILESALIRYAAANITDESLQVLAKCLEGIKSALDENNLEEYTRQNTLFDETIYEAAGNKTVPLLIKQVKTRIARLQLRTILLPGRKTDSLKEHQAIYNALKNHDQDAAEVAVTAHLKSITQTFESVWGLLRL
ncbi:MAG: GntR family transcriptional regulator [Sphaerochaetaceae bacterium]|nr:GntR family transcriptional regulator [Sphaerochaetaceae bacterium]